MIKVSGYSDDIVEISRTNEEETVWEEEFDSYDMDTLFRFDDGTLLRMHYEGAWKAYVQEAGTAHHMIMPLIAGDDYYSDLFTINTDIIQAHWKEKPKEG